MALGTLGGPNAVKGYAAIAVEVTEGTFVAPADTSQIPISDVSVDLTGGTMGIDAVAGTRYMNLAVRSAELLVAGTLNGPFSSGAPLLMTAAMGGSLTTPGAASMPSYSLEINPGGANSMNVAGSLIDQYTVKGAAGSVVTYSAGFKAQSLVQGAKGTPSLASLTVFGLKDVAISGPLLNATGTAFEITINNNVKTQPVFGAIQSKYLFSAGLEVTGKATMVMAGNGDAATINTSTSTAVTIVVTLAYANGSPAQTFTMANGFLTKVGAAVKVGSVTMQDVEWIAAAPTGVPIAIT